MKLRTFLWEFLKAPLRYKRNWIYTWKEELFPSQYFEHWKLR